MNIHQIDLNLLVLFNALYQSRSVSIAADTLCISQSAFSHGLSRLRKRLSDDLFVRINNVMEPTLVAHELALYVSPALEQIQSGLNSGESFDPLTSELELVFAATDYMQFSLLPRLVSHISEKAPNIAITVIPSEDKMPTDKLINGDIDFILGFSHEVERSSTIDYQTWFTDSYITIAKKNHPQLVDGLSLDKFLQLSHVRISPWGEKQGVVDLQLAKLGYKRNVLLQLPSVLAAPYAIQNSELLLTLPKHVASHVAKDLDVELYSTPVQIPEYQLNVYWHKLNANKASHRWLTKLIKELANG